MHRIPDLSTAAWRKSSRSAGANNCVEIATGTEWRKSSRSTGANGCVEVATGAEWRKSSRSAGADNCVEVAGGQAWAAVRDSKDRSGPVLTVDARQFTAFVDGVRSGQLGPQ